MCHQKFAAYPSSNECVNIWKSRLLLCLCESSRKGSSIEAKGRLRVRYPRSGPRPRKKRLGRDGYAHLETMGTEVFASSSSRRSKDSFIPCSMPDWTIPSRSATDWKTE